MAFSIRLDAETEAKIRRLAKTTGRTKSAVVRDAMAEYGTDEAPAAGATSALERVRPFIGIVATTRQVSSRTHEKYRALVRRKHHARRPR